MTKQKILEKALLMAHKNGWKPVFNEWKNVEVQQWQGQGMIGIALLYSEGEAAVTWMRELEGIIFNHDFAKCLWGDGRQMSDKEAQQAGASGLFVGKALDISKYGWQYHLQRMVVADDPIAYLKDNI